MYFKDYIKIYIIVLDILEIFPLTFTYNQKYNLMYYKN